MIKIFKTYFPEILVFVFISAIFIIDLTPDMTLMNKSLDSFEFLFGAKYLYTTHQMSVPLYLLISHLFLMIPLGTDAWRMGLLSVMSSLGTCIFIYLIILKSLKVYPNKRLYALIGVLIFGTSALVISQSIIVQTYALLTLFIVGAYYFAISGRKLLLAVMVGLGLAVHPLMIIPMIIYLIFYKEYRDWKFILVSLSFLVFYLYIVLANKNPDLISQDGLIGSILNLIAVVDYFVGTTSIFDLPKRILDAIGVIGLSIAGISIIPIIYYFKSLKFYKYALFWLAVIPILLFISDIDTQTFDYMLPSIPFLAISASIGICKYFVVYGKRIIKYAYAFIGILFLVGMVNCNYFDIGRTLDKNMSAATLYESLDSIPKNAVLISFNLSMISLYNKEHDANIYLIEVGKLDDQSYLEGLKESGIKLNYYKNNREIAQSIVLKNDNVWYAKLIDPKVYEYKIIECNHNVDIIPLTKNDGVIVDTEELNKRIEWKIKPSNPYDILTTRTFLTEWQYATMSRYNFRVVVVVIIILWIIISYVFKNVCKQKKY